MAISKDVKWSGFAAVGHGVRFARGRHVPPPPRSQCKAFKVHNWSKDLKVATTSLPRKQ